MSGAFNVIRPKVGHLMGRRLVLLAACLVVTLGSFFLTLRFVDFRTPPGAVLLDGRPASERLAAQRVASSAELPALASQIRLKFAREMHGNVDSLRRTS